MTKAAHTPPSAAVAENIQDSAGAGAASTALAVNVTAHRPSHLWQKGQSGNPGGRPKIEARIRAKAARESPKAWDRLVKLSKSSDEKISLEANKAILALAGIQLRPAPSSGPAVQVNVGAAPAGPITIATPEQASRIYHEIMRGDVDPASVTFALPPPEARAEPHGDVFDVQPEQSATPVGAAPERSGDTDEARSGQAPEPHAVDDMLNAWKQLSDQPPEPEAATPRPTLEQVLAERRQETEARNNAEALRQRRDGLLRDWRQARSDALLEGREPPRKPQHLEDVP